MTEPEMERRVYQQDEPELFGQVESLVFASVFEIEVDGVRYLITRGDDDTVGAFYLLKPQGLAQGE